MEQPNVTNDGDAALTPAFWLAVVATGVAAGLFGDLMMVILFGVQHAVFGYHAATFEAGVEAAGATRRIVVLLVAGVFGGVAWYVLRRWTSGEGSDVDDAIWRGDGKLSFRRSLGTSVISEIVIGSGASIGREAAPKTMGAVSAGVIAGWIRLSPPQRRLLVACGGGAGLAAVYNVPLGGALFTAEILLGTVALPVMLPALVCSGIATVTGWIYLPDQATFLHIPSYRASAPLFVGALLAGPIFGVAATGFVRLVAWVSHHQLSGRKALGGPLVAFAVLGLIGIEYPQLLGNGKDMAHDAFLGTGGVALLAALAMLKPVVTSICLGSGATGGLFTPVMSTGAVLGAALGIIWSHMWPGSPVGAYAMIGASAMIGAGMQAPLAALALVLELTHAGFSVMVPMVIATAVATAVARYLDGYSIYSARLAAVPGEEGPSRSP